MIIGPLTGLPLADSHRDCQLPSADPTAHTNSTDCRGWRAGAGKETSANRRRATSATEGNFCGRLAFADHDDHDGVACDVRGTACYYSCS